MSFNWYFQKASDPTRSNWRRWQYTLSALNRCFPRPLVTYPATKADWEKRWNITKENPPTDAQISQALCEMQLARSQRLHHVRAFDHKRTRQKMRGRRLLTRAEQEEWQKIDPHPR